MGSMHIGRNGLAILLSLGFAIAGFTAGCSKSADTASTATAPATPPASTPTPSPTSGPADGASLFDANCSGCHGSKGTGGKRAPKLAGRQTPEDETTKAVTLGKGRMPSFKSRLSGDQITAIAKYVATL